MPPKIRDLVKRLEAAGFADHGGNGSHRNFAHPKGQKITISGKPGDDAKPYQERGVDKAIQEAER
jgi:predicted RNA binding protein YcfA (HicA-like mRNA interferase family)